MSTLTHIAEVTSRSGRRINPLTYGSAAWRKCYGDADVADRRKAVSRDPDLELTIRDAPRRRTR